MLIREATQLPLKLFVIFHIPCEDGILYNHGTAHYLFEKNDIFSLEEGIQTHICRGKLKDICIFFGFIPKSLKVSLVFKNHFFPYCIYTSKATDFYFNQWPTVNLTVTSLNHLIL